MVSDVVTMFWTIVITKNETAHAYKLREESCRIVRVDLKHVNDQSHLRPRCGNNGFSHDARCWRSDRRHQDRIQEYNIGARTGTAAEKQYGDDEGSHVMVYRDISMQWDRCYQDRCTPDNI